MDLTHLSNEEIDYELALRFVVNLGPSTHRNKVLKLRELMTQDEGNQDNVYRSSEHVMPSISNIETCQVRISELKTLIDEAIQIKDPFAITQLRSRLLHYEHRLESIQPLPPFASTKQTLCSLVKVLKNEVENALAQIGKRSDRSDSAVTNINPSSGSNGEQGSKKRNQTFEEDTSEAYALLGASSNNQQLQTSNLLSSATSHAEVIERQSMWQSEQHPMNNASRRSTEGAPQRVNGAGGDISNQGLQDSCIGHDHDPQMSATSSPLVAGRGRGISIRNQQQLRSNTGGRGRANHIPTSLDSRNGGNNNDDITFRNIIVNNASLYADLVERLARRDRYTGAPSTERSEDRRMMKAVHNWPFKFRGEKDTTSLNVFLDRVETFAKSEGMSDDTLLSSIKHLLQDDALDWYARAMSQRLLFSWHAFKQEIRREFLPSGYAQILRLEASFRFQGQSETFAKYYRDIAALFRFISPPMTEEEKFFIVKKNMNADYAAIVTAARPADLREMVEVCTSYDETRMLLNRQRRIPLPHNALLEPNFATPVSSTKPFNQPQHLRYPRINAVESTDKGDYQHTHHFTALPEIEAATNDEEAEWHIKMDQLLQQVNALKGQFDRKNSRPPGGPIHDQIARTTSQQSALTRAPLRAQLAHQQQRLQTGQFQEGQSQLNHSSQYPQLSQQQSARPAPIQQSWEQQQSWQHQQQQPWQQRPMPDQCYPARSGAQQTGENSSRSVMTCWNCDEEGHRFMDCPKPQAVLFCYRCGRKGYSLRSCFTCRTDAGNQQAENQH